MSLFTTKNEPAKERHEFILPELSEDQLFKFTELLHASTDLFLKKSGALILQATNLQKEAILSTTLNFMQKYLLELGPELLEGDLQKILNQLSENISPLTNEHVPLIQKVMCIVV